MKIKLDEALQTYMNAHGHKDLVLYIKKGNGCCSGSFLMAKARFAKAGDESLLNAGYETIESEMGKIYYQPDKLIFGKNPQLICDQFLGKAIIQVLDIYAADDRFNRCNPVKGLMREE